MGRTGFKDVDRGDQIALLVLALVCLAAASSYVNHTHHDVPARFLETSIVCPVDGVPCTRVVQDLTDGSCWGMTASTVFGPVPCD